MECTVVRSGSRTRILLRHEPALLPGALVTPRDGFRALRLLARAVAGRFNAERTLATAKAR
jgi:hypothetical protein